MNDIQLSDLSNGNGSDLVIVSGDFAIGDSTSQEVENIILAFPGWWSEFPSLGCSAAKYLASPNANQLSSSIQVQLKSDNKQMTSFSSTFNSSGQLVINVNGIQIVLG